MEGDTQMRTLTIKSSNFPIQLAYMGEVLFCRFLYVLTKWMAPYKPVSHFGPYRKGNDIKSGQKYIEPAQTRSKNILSPQNLPNPLILG